MSYRFDGFEFDPRRGLSRAGEPVPLEPQAFELLLYLIENRGRVVTKAELGEQLWGGRIISDAALSTQIRSVRRALGDDRARQSFVRTLPKRGFQFVAEVVGTDAVPEESSLQRKPARRRAVLALAAIGLLLLAGALTIWLIEARDNADPTAPPRLSLAVLPFENLSGDASKDYLADAFTEDLITDLSRIQDMFVISRSTSFTYRGKPVAADQVASELGVRYVLEGSLHFQGDLVRVNAQLIDGQTNAHIWSNRYERSLAELFSHQDGVTGRIASVLRAKLRVAEEQRQTSLATQDAWDLALRGNVILYSRRTAADFREAQGLLERAVALDPTISLAWSGLSFIQYAASQSNIPGVSQPDSAQRSLDLALKAAAADPANAEAFWLIGAGYAVTGQAERGVEPCEIAIELNPNMDCGYVCRGMVLMALGQPEKATPEFNYALKLNPLFRAFVKHKLLGLALIQSGQDGMAIDTLNRGLAGSPQDLLANLAMISALALVDRVPEAQSSLKSLRSRIGAKLPSLSDLHGKLGWIGPGAERMLEGLRRAGLEEH